MKKIAFIAALCSSMVFAQEAPVAPAPEAVAPEALVTCTPAEAEAIVDEVIASLTEVTEVLESITDTASADAAVEKIEALKVRMEAAQVKMDSLGEPDEATQEKLAVKLLPALFTLAPRMEAAMQRIAENNCYDSAALMSVMENL